MDEIACVGCPDCGACVRVSFCILYASGGKIGMVYVASCAVCRKGGDSRSIHIFKELSKKTFRDAVSMKLPVLLDK